jgi:acetyl esterase/lipase
VAVDHEHGSLKDMWALYRVALERSRIDSKLPCVTPLWPHGAPGFRHRRNELEAAKSYWVRNVYSLSLTAFLPPKDLATGAVVIICSGAGHAELVFGMEIIQRAQWFQARKCCLSYDLATQMKQDGQRAMRLVRSMPKEFGIDPKRAGMLGFSAGRDVISMVAHEQGLGNETARHPVDRFAA